MEVYLIRHTKPIIDAGVCYGQSDIPLASTYEQEAKVLISKLPDRFDMVFSSPLQRCRLLAERLSTSDFKIDERLLELNFGTWEMRKWDDIAAGGYKEWFDDFVNAKPLQGESFRELAVRVNHVLEDLKKCSYKKVALVTHAGFIRTAMTMVLGMPLENAFQMSFEYGTISLIKYNEGNFRLYFLNR